MKAKVVPYSSVVGSSVLIYDEQGNMVCQLALLSIAPANKPFDREQHKSKSTEVAQWLADLINGQ